MAMNFVHNDTTKLSNLPNGGYDFLITLARHIANMLMAHGWTFFASSTGATMSTATDNFPTGFVDSNSMYSWLTVKSPAGIVAGGSGYVWLTFTIDPNYYLGLSLHIHRTEPTLASPQQPPGSSSRITSGVRINSSDWGGMGIGTWYFNMVMWSNGCWYAAIGKAGEGRFRYMLGLYPLSDVYYNHPYPVALKVCARHPTSAMDENNLDNMQAWNMDGTVAENNLRVLYMANSSFIVGLGCSAFGDAGGNNLHSKLYLYNTNAGSVMIVGKLGAEAYDFGITGCTALPNGSIDASTPKRNFYDRLLLPANAVMMS